MQSRWCTLPQPAPCQGASTARLGRPGSGWVALRRSLRCSGTRQAPASDDVQITPATALRRRDLWHGIAPRHGSTISSCSASGIRLRFDGPWAAQVWQLRPSSSSMVIGIFGPQSPVYLSGISSGISAATVPFVAGSATTSGSAACSRSALMRSNSSTSFCAACQSRRVYGS